MKDRPLSWRVFPPFVAIALCAIFAAAWYASHAVRGFHYEQTEQRLQAAAGMVVEHLAASGEPLDSPQVDEICDVLGKASGYRVTVILPSGRVMGDSEEDPARMDDHSTRPEVSAALREGLGCSQHFSKTLKMNMMYVAVLMPGDGKRQAVVRMALSLADVDGAVDRLRHRIVVAGLILAAMATGLQLMFSRRISRTLARIRLGAESFAAGDLSARLPPSDVSEMNLLAQTMNDMAGQLQDRIGDITRQRDEQGALFACMTESVVAVDTERRIMKMNAATEALFGVSTDACIGRNIVEVIRNSELHDIVENALGRTEPAEGSIHLFDRDMYLQVHGTGLRGPSGEKIGAVVVLNNVTRIRRLETMRRDFVANVSHELKTPITSVIGFVETLREGAAEQKEERDRFLNIIHRHASRLKSIVDDLLTLSRIEHDAESDEADLADGAVAPVLESAVQACRTASEARNMRVAIECPPDLRTAFDRQLLEQAITNLLDNALKYSEPGENVVIKASQTPEEVAISVQDEGPGIEKQHLARLFERFYRVDKGRSRKLGGTGLGLAIVKHVVTLHSGRVEVDTAPGQGSTFTILLPKRPRE